MSDWVQLDKKEFWRLLVECFPSSTDQDGRDAYEACKPFGPKASGEALKRLRDDGKGKVWRVDITRLATVAHRLADEEIARIEGPKRDAEREQAVARARGETPLQQAQARARASANATEQAELYAMRDELLCQWPHHAAFYGGKDPRRFVSLALMIFEPAIGMPWLMPDGSHAPMQRTAAA